MGALIPIGLMFVLVIAVLVGVRLSNDKYTYLQSFRRGNVIVFGHKGCGKDLLYNYAINKRKRPCLSNIQYNKDYCTKVDIKSLFLKDDTGRQLDYNQLMNGELPTIEKTFDEKVDYYISDAGVYLPSQYHGLLDRDYKSLPITYALSRHLADFNVHVNTQALSRVWDKLREQADTYICAKRTYKLPGLLLTKAIYYDKYESAKQGLLPFKGALFKSSERKARQVEYDATNGVIRTLYILQRKRDIKYDTRAFHEVLYGYKAVK